MGRPDYRSTPTGIGGLPIGYGPYPLGRRSTPPPTAPPTVASEIREWRRAWQMWNRRVMIEFWRDQQTTLQKKVRKSRWDLNNRVEALSLLKKWKEMSYSGKTWPQIQTTIRDYLLDEYELHLRTIDEITQAACKRKKPSAMMLVWGDPCRPQFNHKSANGYWEIASLRRELLVTTTNDWTGVAWQIHRWYQRFWLRTTPAGMLNSMMAGAFIGVITGSVGYMSARANAKMAMRSSPRLPASVARQRITNSKVNAKLNAKSRGGSSKWKMDDYFPESGMPENHFNVMFDVVDEMAAEGKPVAAVFRLTNRKSTRGIRLRWPAKKMDLKANTDPATGIVTCKTKKEVHDAREAGYYVVDIDFIPRNKKGEPLKVGKIKGWSPSHGEVLDPKQKLPIVGDYDLRGVIDLKSPGANVSLRTRGEENVANRIDGLTEEFARRVNAKLGRDQPRIMHGGADQFMGLENEGVVVMLPGRNAAFNNDGNAVKKLYSDQKRKTVNQSYGKLPRDNPNAHIGKGGRKR